MKINTKDLSAIVDKYHEEKSSLIAVLQDIQEKYHWLPPEVIQFVSDRLSIPLIDVYSVVTFYRAFSLTPRGKHILTVCLGTACHVRGAPMVLDRFKSLLKIDPGCTTGDGRFTLESVNCLGACALAPIVVVDGHYHGQTTVKKIDQIFEKHKKKRSRKKAIRKTKK